MARPRKSALDVAKAAIDAVVAKLEAKRREVQELEAELDAMRDKLGVSKPQVGRFFPADPPVGDEPGVLPENLNPADNMGPGREV